jgi:hypothetical protein
MPMIHRAPERHAARILRSSSFRLSAHANAMPAVWSRVVVGCFARAAHWRVALLLARVGR